MDNFIKLYVFIETIRVSQKPFQIFTHNVARILDLKQEIFKVRRIPAERQIWFSNKLDYFYNDREYVVSLAQSLSLQKHHGGFVLILFVFDEQTLKTTEYTKIVEIAKAKLQKTQPKPPPHWKPDAQEMRVYHLTEVALPPLISMATQQRQVEQKHRDAMKYAHHSHEHYNNPHYDYLPHPYTSCERRSDRQSSQYVQSDYDEYSMMNSEQRQQSRLHEKPTPRTFQEEEGLFDANSEWQCEEERCGALNAADKLRCKECQITRKHESLHFEDLMKTSEKNTAVQLAIAVPANGDDDGDDDGDDVISDQKEPGANYISFTSGDEKWRRTDEEKELHTDTERTGSDLEVKNDVELDEYEEESNDEDEEFFEAKVGDNRALTPKQQKLPDAKKLAIARAAPELPKPPKPAEPQVEMVTIEAWSCIKCSFKNDLTKSNCEICLENRPKKEAENGRPLIITTKQITKAKFEQLQADHEEIQILAEPQAQPNPPQPIVMEQRETKPPKTDGAPIETLNQANEARKAENLQEDSWKCHKCSFKNSIDNVNCSICLEDRYQHQQQKQPQENLQQLRNEKENAAPALAAPAPGKHRLKPKAARKIALNLPNPVNPANPAIPPNAKAAEKVEFDHWNCPKCTLTNDIIIVNCEVCDFIRPAHIVVPKNPRLSTKAQLRNEREREKELAERDALAQQNQNVIARLEALDNMKVIVANEDFECPICMNDVTAQSQLGVMLRNCFHKFCKECLVFHLTGLKDPIVQCPNATCKIELEDREIRGLLTDEQYAKYEALVHRVAEARMQNTFHCQTVDCRAYCVFEDENNVFECPICLKKNCILCRAIHEKLTCKQYQQELEAKRFNDEAARKDFEYLEQMLNEGKAMRCPGCKIVIQKKDGCDWIQCATCKTEICWVTRGPRWGPKGRNDTSAGCKCNVDGKKCHPNCGNCH